MRIFLFYDRWVAKRKWKLCAQWQTPRVGDRHIFYLYIALGPWIIIIFYNLRKLLHKIVPMANIEDDALLQCVKEHANCSACTADCVYRRGEFFSSCFIYSLFHASRRPVKNVALKANVADAHKARVDSLAIRRACGLMRYTQREIATTTEWQRIDYGVQLFSATR